jgi:hypothetical protein
MQKGRKMNKLYRHGDVIIQKINEPVPENAKKVKGNILVHGEVTGHAHRLVNPDTFQIYESEQFLYIDVMAEETSIIHEEHAPITLEKGTYKVWVQREYTPQQIRRVLD